MYSRMAGTGFVWDEQGHIVTNFHVVDSVVQQGQELEVTLADQTTHRAQVVGIAPEKDLAVVRLVHLLRVDAHAHRHRGATPS